MMTSLCFVYKMAFLLLVAISWLTQVTQGDIILQSDSQCKASIQHLERVQDVDELEVYSHSGREYYAPNMDCIVTILGKQYNQWEITITRINIDKEKDNCRSSRPPCCNDFLKIFNSYRVDNARLFPSIPWQGLCGSDLPRQATYTSSQNYITIQFSANPVSDYMTGFSLHLRQYPRRNSGTELSQGGYIGGWNDGYLRELQIDWKAQELIPGDYQPGKDPNFEYDPNGISCYECQGCKRDYFRTSDIGVTIREGCFVCIKEWLQGSSLTARTCMSRNSYQERLRTLSDTSGGNSVTDFRACKTLLRGVQGTTYINLCVCDTSNCNKGGNVKFSWHILFIAAAAVTLFLAA